MQESPHTVRMNRILALVLLGLSLTLLLVPTGYEGRVDGDAVRCAARVLSVDNAEMQVHGMVRTGHQVLELELLDGPFKGTRVDAVNQLRGMLDRDPVFFAGDRALAVITRDADGDIGFVNAQAHYRLDLELLLFGLFAVLLLAFGGWTGARALLSFVFTGLVLWKGLIPLLLRGVDPMGAALAVVFVLTGAIVFMVAGVNRVGIVAFAGSILGVGTAAGLAWFFTPRFHVSGAVLPFAETLLYSGYGHLNLTELFMAAVFLASSGAVMDLAMDVAASMGEVAAKRPDMSRGAVFLSGLRVGRAVVGTMTTTLLLAYSGGYVTLLMAFMAQGVPLANLFNLSYVAAEILKILAGSFGLVAVAPFTALAGSLVLAGRSPVEAGAPAKISIN